MGTLWTPTSTHNPEPLYYTKRNPARETKGPEIVNFLARCAPKPIQPMPWQRDFYDLIGEIDPDTGGLWYRTVILILPRQGGKTTLLRGKMAHRGITQKGAKMLYTAQDRNKARQRLEETIYDPLSLSQLSKALGRPRWQAGSEAVRFTNRSIIRIESLTKTAGHGDTLDEAYIDEAFAHTDFRIEQNVKPTMITVQGAQMIIASAAGGFESTYLLTKRDRGRALVEMGKDSRTAYVEYSAPLDADPLDPATFLAAHPAITHTIQLADIEDDRINMDTLEFNRAYLGWWPTEEDIQTVIPMNLWKQNYVDPDIATWYGEPIWSIDVAPDRTWASIGLAARSFDPAATCFLEVIDQRNSGTDWIIRQEGDGYVGRIRDLSNRFGGRRVVVDGSGPGGALALDLEAAGFEVYRCTAKDKADACGKFFDDTTQGHVKYLDDPVLTGAMKAAEKVQAMAGESWVFSRGKSHADISPLYAATFARFAFAKFAPVMYDPLDSVLGA
jgi:phage terminase large subunit-like protein